MTPIGLKTVCSDAGRFLGGALLLSSGLLKYYLPDYASTEFFSLTSPVWLQALSTYEIGLGLFLVFRVLGGFEAYLAAATFFLFSVVQIYFVATGKRSCGCLGTLSVPPTIMLVIDVIILSLLACYLRVNRPVARVSFGSLAIILACVATAFGLEKWAFGGKESFFALVSDSPYYLVQGHVDLGGCEMDQILSSYAEIRNRSDGPIQIVGASESSMVTASEDLPLVIEPGAVGRIRFSLEARGQPGRNIRPFVIYCIEQDRLTSLEMYCSWVNP